MRQTLLLIGFLAGALALIGYGAAFAADKHEHPAKGHAAKYKGELKTKDGSKKVQWDMSEKDHQKLLLDAAMAGELEVIEIDHPPNPMAIVWDLGLWAVVVFAALVFILRKAAWGPMLEGLQKREEHIKNAVEEAKQARAETQRISAEFKAKMDQAYAEIPKIMEQARRDAEAFKEEMRTQTTKDIQTERQRLRREIETARDQALQELWHQAAQLATLISAKAIGRSLTEDDHRRLLDEALAEIGQGGRRQFKS